MPVNRQQKQPRIRESDTEQRVRDRTAELQGINEALQREIQERKKAEEALQAHRQELQDYIDSMSTMNAKVAPDGRFLLVNKAGQQASGLPMDQLLNTHFLDGKWWAFDPAVKERVARAFSRARAGEHVNYDEKAFVFGRVIDINFSLVPVRDDKGQVAYIVAEGRDINALKQAEAAIAVRTQQLEAANKELEAFCYSVSHDLRAPLRSIDGFTKALIEDFGDKLSEAGKGYAERVVAATRRMGLLIEDLLKLSRISRGDLTVSDVDLSRSAREIADELKETAPDRAVTFVIQPGLVAKGDPRLLRVVLENLLNNAWKFTRGQKSARIEFGGTSVNGSKTFFVRDNGAGFDMAYASKLFGAFQRLHAPEDFEGAGIGLATVQRILHRHGGRAWADAAVGKGASFYFSLPK